MKLIEILKAWFFKETIDTITDSLTKTVAKLEAHSQTQAAAVDAVNQAIDDKVAEHKADLEVMQAKARVLVGETQRAAEIANRIGSLLK